MKVLVIGGGGREHCVCWKLSMDNRIDKLYCLPGNAGIADIAQCVDIAATDIDRIVQWVETNKPDKVVVTPDDPLALGLVDRLTQIGVPAFGPTASAARIESSKAFSKALMKKYGIPTAEFEVFGDMQSALDYIQTAPLPLVVKADGLALGKGVIICDTREQAQDAVTEMMQGKAFGDAGNTVVVEQFLKGYEVTVLAFCDGKTVVPLPTSQDHKRALDGDQGLNTGGMGTFSPSNKFSPQLMTKAVKTIFEPTVRAMSLEGCPFCGVLYFGLMVDAEDIKVLEYNARFGDPETQSLLPRLKTPLMDVFDAVMQGKLDELNIEWEDNATVCVVLASGGYPKKYLKGKPITIQALDDGILLFHAGTARDDTGRLVTNGGRVLNIVAKADTLASARDNAYKNVCKVAFDGAHFRTDIAKDI